MFFEMKWILIFFFSTLKVDIAMDVLILSWLSEINNVLCSFTWYFKILWVCYIAEWEKVMSMEIPKGREKTHTISHSAEVAISATLLLLLPNGGRRRKGRTGHFWIVLWCHNTPVKLLGLSYTILGFLILKGGRRC